jgi:prophage DNA circulation protein
MIPAGSRYEQAEKDFTQSHLYNEYGYPYIEGDAPNLKIKVEQREATYLMVTDLATAAPVLNYFVKQDEGPQWIGYKFTGNAARWWELAVANPQIWYPLDLAMGDYIGVPVQT